jgi:hypothetical protein
MLNWKNKKSSMVGSSLKGYITASHDELVSVFGLPKDVDGDKVSTQWIVQAGNTQYSIYDYKETNVYDDRLPSVEQFRARASYEWHIGGFDNKHIADLAEFISEKIGRKVEFKAGY